MSTTYPSVGAHYEKEACIFTVWAPGKKNIALQLSNGTLHPLKKIGFGYWSAKIDVIKPGTTYKYLLDDGNAYPDPASRRQPEGVHGPSAVTDPSYAWTDAAWKGIPLADMILYELHVGAFTPQSNFEGVISKLDYLDDLGVNAIELMPVAQFPGERNWGYDGVFPFAVQESYGGAEGLKRLVNEAHQRGIAIVLDVVYNHLGPEGNYVSQFAPYYTDKYKTPWGNVINFDDAHCDGVRHFFWQNALMWLDEFHIDGLRLDAVHAIWDFSANHFISELKKKLTELEQRTGRKKVLIAELDLNNPRYIDPPQKGGYGLDGQWIDEFHHALHAVVTGEVNGYYEDFGKMSDIAKSLKDSYVYTGQYSVHRKKHFGALPADHPYSQFVVFAQNHDQVGNRLAGDRLSTQVSFECLKLVAATVLLSPHVPLLFMGEEFYETNPFQYFVHHSDETLIKNIRQGRKDEFHYFHWEGEIPDPQDENTFRQCLLSWKYPYDETAGTLLKYYKSLIALRKTHPAFRCQDRHSTEIYHRSPDDKIIGFTRHCENHQALIVLNFDKEPGCFSTPFTHARKLFDSSGKEWMGPGTITPAGITGEQRISITPESAVIFEI